MKICKICGIEKPLDEYSFYSRYPEKRKPICKACANEKIRIYLKNKETSLKKVEDIIREFNMLNSAEKMLDLFKEGYDVSWGGKNIIIFNKKDRVVHAKNATKEIYNLVFARYCLEVEKRFEKNN